MAPFLSERVSIGKFQWYLSQGLFWFDIWLVDGVWKMDFLVEHTNAMMTFTLPITKHILVLIYKVCKILQIQFLKVSPAPKLELKLEDFTVILEQSKMCFVIGKANDTNWWVPLQNPFSKRHLLISKYIHSTQKACLYCKLSTCSISKFYHFLKFFFKMQQTRAERRVGRRRIW